MQKRLKNGDGCDIIATVAKSKMLPQGRRTGVFRAKLRGRIFWEVAIQMNKTELIAEVAEKSGLSKKDAEAAVKAVIDSVTEALVQGDKVQLVGFGTFEVRERAARFGRDPRTGESMEIAASKAPAFKVGQALKDAVNGRK